MNTIKKKLQRHLGREPRWRFFILETATFFFYLRKELTKVYEVVY